MVFGLIGLITGPLWARKAWGVWWEWDVKLTLTLVVWLTFVAYLLLRRYRRAGIGEAGGRCRHLRRGQHPVRVLLGQLVADHPSEDQRRADAAARACAARSGSASLAFMLLMVLIVAARVRLERQRALVDDLFLSLED